jgi:hypothetical protein
MRLGTGWGNCGKLNDGLKGITTELFHAGPSTSDFSIDCIDNGS